ncbi:MAG: DUF420 domain-containing protein, partial [Planctomycetota bacterium]
RVSVQSNCLWIAVPSTMAVERLTTALEGHRTCKLLADCNNSNVAKWSRELGLGNLLDILPHLNAGLNALAAVLLVAGFVLIKQKKETAHKWTMLSCFGVSIVFLVCYLTYHQLLHQTTGSHGRAFEHPNAIVLWGYRLLLISHVLLAATVPFLAVATIYFGLRDNRKRHRKLAKWTFPIWLYVSVTGVIVYLMLYQMFSR